MGLALFINIKAFNLWEDLMAFSGDRTLNIW